MTIPAQVLKMFKEVMGDAVIGGKRWKDWKGYAVYTATFKQPMTIGPGLYVLCKNGKYRYPTGPEAWEINRHCQPN